MKICIVGPGYMPIGENMGWGAVESLIWDYKCELEKLGVEVLIVNTTNMQDAIYQINNFNPNFVHIQFDDHYHISPHINCKNKAITSHYAYLEQINKMGGYINIFKGFISSDSLIFCLSENIKEVYLNQGVDSNRLYVTPNGARDDSFEYNNECEYRDKSIYLAKIDYRKRQYLFQDIMDIDFVGNIADNRFNTNRSNYLGEWKKDFLYKNLTKYANLILLSDGEAHPLVCAEALMAGLGLVISEYATANLDLSKPFIDVISENKINDLEYIRGIIKTNREKSLKYRNEIREYALSQFSWSNVVPKYLEQIKNIINQ